ncbi:MAG: PPOX class F420-dependent oxidoreductase [Chloroflexota bacterium]
MESDRTAWLEQGQFINLTTFRKNGQAIATPVWFVWCDKKLYVYTRQQSGKVKRIRANGRALIAPCDVRGNPVGEFVPARGKILYDEIKMREIDRLFDKKYGIQRKLIGLISRLHRNRQVEIPCFLVFELVEEQETTAR